jgi:2-methylisocitrate lyase-like PEP mutase family enzyme
MDQSQKAKTFRQLHQQPHAFVIPNPWDVGTSRLLAAMGFKALATTSMGYAFSVGQRDNTLSREQTLAYIAAVATSTDLPVSADLENGFGDQPEVAAETIRLAASAGAVGGSIEDSTGRADDPIYAIEFATERIRASVEASRSLNIDFVLTARAENFLHGRPNLDDTIRRLQAYQEAGADVLYAPGLRSREDIASVVAAVDRPVNVVMGLQGVRLSVDDLSAIGVKRISVGSALYRAAIGAFLEGAREMASRGTFCFATGAASPKEISQFFD